MRIWLNWIDRIVAGGPLPGAAGVLLFHSVGKENSTSSAIMRNPEQLFEKWSNNPETGAIILKAA
jgi:enoyl-CoA hydratase/carnithine racemase